MIASRQRGAAVAPTSPAGAKTGAPGAVTDPAALIDQIASRLDQAIGLNGTRTRADRAETIAS